MNDKYLMENIMFGSKTINDLYLHGVIESSNKKVYDVFLNSLVEALKLHYDIYKIMEAKGFYSISNTDEENIKNTLDNLSLEE